MGIGRLSKKKANKEVKSVLGLDASTNTVAWCLYSKDGPIRWGEIEFFGDTAFERLSFSQKAIKAILNSNKNNDAGFLVQPDLVVFESAVFIQNKKTVVLLAYAFGAIVGALVQHGTRVEELPPITWQNAIGNKPLTKEEKDRVRAQNPNKSASWYSNKYREIRKQRTMDWVETRFGIKSRNDNVSDAIAIASVAYDKFSG